MNLGSDDPDDERSRNLDRKYILDAVGLFIRFVAVAFIQLESCEDTNVNLLRAILQGSDCTYPVHNSEKFATEVRRVASHRGLQD